MKKPINATQLQALLPECCRVGVASIADYQGLERNRLLELMPSVQSVVVIAHHVQDSLEWTWLKFPAARNGETSPADMHCLAMTERVSNRLEANGAQCAILPYPGICGLMFKTIALPTGLGRLGDNFLFMIEEWGPWVHLRVLLTDVAIEHARKQAADACIHCGKCIQVCPAAAFQAGTFNGVACRDKMREMRKTQSDGSFCYECELCLRACPVGTRPKEIKVRFKD